MLGEHVSYHIAIQSNIMCSLSYLVCERLLSSYKKCNDFVYMFIKEIVIEDLKSGRG